MRRISKRELNRFLKQSKRQKAIATYYNVSRRTVCRYIKKYGLVGVSKRGFRSLPKKPEKIKVKRLAKTWVLTKDYINRLNEEFDFVNINYPPRRFINQRTLVCSNLKRNPKGFYTTVGIYFIVYVSNVYFLFTVSIRYSEENKPFKEIWNWIKTNVATILEERYPHYYIVKPVAYTFSRPARKPKAIGYG